MADEVCKISFCCIYLQSCYIRMFTHQTNLHLWTTCETMKYFEESLCNNPPKPQVLNIQCACIPICAHTDLCRKIKTAICNDQTDSPWTLCLMWWPARCEKSLMSFMTPNVLTETSCYWKTCNPPQIYSTENRERTLRWTALSLLHNSENTKGILAKRSIVEA